MSESKPLLQDDLGVPKKSSKMFTNANDCEMTKEDLLNHMSNFPDKSSPQFLSMLEVNDGKVTCIMCGQAVSKHRKAPEGMSRTNRSANSFSATTASSGDSYVPKSAAPTPAPGYYSAGPPPPGGAYPPSAGGYGTGGAYEGQPVMGGVAPSHMSNASNMSAASQQQQQLAQQPGGVHQIAMAAASGAGPTSVIKATPESHLRAQDAGETHTTVVATMEPPMTGTQQRSLSNTICCGGCMLVIWCAVGFAVCFFGIYSAALPGDNYYSYDCWDNDNSNDGGGFNDYDDGGSSSGVICYTKSCTPVDCGPAFSAYRNPHAFSTAVGVYIGGALFGILLYTFLIWNRARKGGRALVAYKWLSMRQPNRTLEGYMNVLNDIHTSAPVLAYTASTAGHSAVGDFRYTNWQNETTPPTIQQLYEMCGNARWVQFVPKLTTKFANGLTKHSYYQQQKEFRQINERGTVIRIDERITIKSATGIVTDLNNMRSGWICMRPGTEAEKASLLRCCFGPLPHEVVDVVNDIRTVEINFIKTVDTVGVVGHA